MGAGWAGALYYADDLALVARDEAEMQAILRIVDRYAREWNFQPAYAKTKVLRFGAARRRRRPLYLPSMHHVGQPPSEGHVDGGMGSNTNPVARAAAYTYLGVIISEDGTFTNHVEQAVLSAVGKATAEVWRITAATGGLTASGRSHGSHEGGG